MLRGRAAGARAGLRPPVHARRVHGGPRRGGRARPDRALGVQLRHVPHGQRPVPAGLALLGRRRRRVAKLRQETDRRIDAVEALELGLVTDAPDDIDWEDEVRIMLEERASLSPDALTGMEANHRFVGPETMETRIFGRLTAWQNWIFVRPNASGDDGRAAPLRHGPQGRLRPQAGVRHVDRLLREDPQQRRPRGRPAAAAGPGELAAQLHQLVEDDGPGRAHRGRLPAHRRRRRPGGLGALRPRGHGGLPVGRVPRRAQLRPAHRVRRAEGRARLAAGARRVPRRPAAPDRHPGRHRARVGRAAAPPRRDRAVALRPAQPLPGERRRGPAPLGDGLPAARLLRARRARGGRGAAAAQLRRPRLPAHPRRVQRGDARTGCRSSCSPTSPTATGSTSSAR